MAGRDGVRPRERHPGPTEEFRRVHNWVEVYVENPSQDADDHDTDHDEVTDLERVGKIGWEKWVEPINSAQCEKSDWPLRSCCFSPSLDRRWATGR